MAGLTRRELLKDIRDLGLIAGSLSLLYLGVRSCIEPVEIPTSQKPKVKYSPRMVYTNLEDFTNVEDANQRWTVSGDQPIGNSGSWHIGIWNNKIEERSIIAKLDLKTPGSPSGLRVDWEIAHNYASELFELRIGDKDDFITLYSNNLRLLPGQGIKNYLIEAKIGKDGIAKTFVNGNLFSTKDINGLKSWHPYMYTKCGVGRFTSDVKGIEYLVDEKETIF